MPAYFFSLCADKKNRIIPVHEETEDQTESAQTPVQDRYRKEIKSGNTARVIYDIK